MYVYAYIFREPKLLSKNAKRQIVEDCDSSTIQYLINSGMPVDTKLLEKTIEEENLDSFKILYKEMPDIDLTNIWNIACSCCSMEIIDYLLDLPLEFDLSKKDLIKNVILFGDSKLFKKILNRCTDPLTIINWNHLSLACDVKKYEIVKIILELGISPIMPVELAQSKNHAGSLLEAALSTHTDHKALFGSNPEPDIRIIELLLDYGVGVDSHNLESAILTENWDIFSLIYRQNSWTNSELSEALSMAMDFGISEKIWKFIQGEIGFSLDDDTLYHIIRFAFNNSDIEALKYFADYYGREILLKKLISKVSRFDTAENLHFLERLIRFLYTREEVFSLIHMDRYNNATKKELENIWSKFDHV